MQIQDYANNFLLVGSFSYNTRNSLNKQTDLVSTKKKMALALKAIFVICPTSFEKNWASCIFILVLFLIWFVKTIKKIF